MLTDDEKQLIEKYLDGDITQEEMKEFEQKLQSSREFDDELRLQEMVKSAITASAKAKLKKELRTLLQKTRTEKVRKPVPRRVYWIAASIVAIFSVTLVFTQMNQPEERLFKEFYSPYPITPSTRGDDLSLYINALVLYNEGSFQKALPLFEEIIGAHPEDFSAQVILGNCHLNLGDVETAKEVFQQVRKNGTGQSKSEATWYMALILLKEEKNEEAIKLLDSLIVGQTIYSGRAEDLLIQMNKY